MAKRIITALIGIPIGLLILYQGGVFLFIVALILGVLGIIEITNLFNNSGLTVSKELSVLGMIIMFSSFYLHNWLLSIIGITTLMVLSSLYIILNYPRANVTILGGTLAAVIYISLMFGFILALRNMENGFILVVLLFLIIWGTDTGAYFIGTFFGKNKLAPKLSPKKSLEGSLGGLGVAIIISILVYPFLNPALDSGLIPVLLLTLVVSVLAQIGDLFESSIKRYAQIKDSGNILPGHGGILDRFDSFFLSAPVYFFILELMIKFD